MSRYLDHHKAPQLPEEVFQKVTADMKAGRLDQFGVRGLNAFIGKTEAWCYCEAPSAEAIRKGHEAMGVKLGKEDIVRVTSLV